MVREPRGIDCGEVFGMGVIANEMLIELFFRIKEKLKDRRQRAEEKGNEDSSGEKKK